MIDTPKKRVRFGLFEADPVTGELWKGSVKLKLGGQPFSILAALLERPGDLVTREELRQRIWPAETFVDFNHGLNAAVNKLRDTLGDSAEEPRYIETMPRRGYRFIGAVTVEEPQLGATPMPITVTAAELLPVSPPESAQLTGEPASKAIPVPQPPKRRLPIYLGAVVVLVFLAGVLYFLHVQADLQAAKVRAEKLEVEAGEARTPSLEIGGKVGPTARSSQLGAKGANTAATTAAWFRTAGVWEVDLAHSEGNDALKLIAGGISRNEGPQPSSDKKKLAFMSDRSGSLEIWSSNADGSSPQKLTTLGTCGSPQWSPDGKWIAFDTQASPGVYVVSAEGPPITAPVPGMSGISWVPRWSRDGKSIYFASRGSDDTQVWKVAIDGGVPQQVTRRGGFAAYESYDGETLYYAKTENENPEIWQMPVGGGPEKLVSPLLRPSSWANWVVIESGILFLNFDANQTSSIEFYDFATRGVRPVRAIPGSSFWLAASRDGKSAWYAEQQAPQQEASIGQERE